MSKKIINIYFDKLLYSPFEFPEYVKLFKNKHIQEVKHPRLAQIILSSYKSILEKYAQKYHHSKQYLLWTHEPYHDWTTTPVYHYRILSSLKRSIKKTIPIHIMNVFTKDVFTHNFRYFYFRSPFKNTDSIISSYQNQQLPIINLEDSQKPVVVLSTYYPKEYYHKNPHTILPIRYKFIQHGYQHGLLDVYGKDWNQHPNVRSVDNSRNKGDRRDTKREILKRHLFNLALENTDYPYYVTEKMWEPIKYHSLPIYRSNETIYQIFPENSFVDTKDFNDDPEQLFEYLQSMTIEEYYTRLLRCQQTFNHVIENQKNTTKRLSSKNPNINYLEYDTCYHHLLKKIKSISK